MNYEYMWNKLKSDIRIKAAKQIPDSKNVVTATASVSRKSTCFEILNTMEQLEKSESNKDDYKKYAL